jgi:hypothetical protein
MDEWSHATICKVWGCAEESLSGFSARPGNLTTQCFVEEVSELPELEEKSP